MKIEIGNFYLARTELVYVFDFSNDEPYRDMKNITTARAIKVECVLDARKYLDLSDGFATIPVTEDTHQVHHTYDDEEGIHNWVSVDPFKHLRQQFQEAIRRHTDGYEKVTSCFRYLNKVIAAGNKNE